MKPKIGRPKKKDGDRHDAALTTKVTTLYSAAFNRKAFEMGISASALLRRGAECVVKPVGNDKQHNL